MKKTPLLYCALIAAVAFMFCLPSMGGGVLRPLTALEMAAYGATHVIEVDHQDLDDITTDDTARVFTNTLTAPVSVEFRGYILDVPFDSDLTTNHFTCAVSVGTSSTAAKWISALEVASDYTPVYYASFGTDYTATTALTSTPTLYTISVDGTNVTASCVTNATVATTGTVTMGSPLVNAQSADVTLHITVGSPGAAQNLGEFTCGGFRTFWRVLGPVYQR